MNFGENLKTIRNQRKMSQEALAEKVGVSRQSVSKWEVGDAYPEMNNILQLCKIFNCKLNDLIHEDMSDFNSLDEDIKMKVVKLKKEQQKKMKGITKAIYILSNITSKIIMVGMIMMTLFMFCVPYIINHTQLKDGNLFVGNNIVEILDGVDTYNKVVKVFNNNSNIKLIFIAEFIILSLIISLYFGYIVFKKMHEIFKRLNDGETPFTLENIKTIKSITKYYIGLILFPAITGYIGQLFLLHVDMEIEVLSMTEIITILVFICISYIFEYGYEIQKDSKGVMYDEK